MYFWKTQQLVNDLRAGPLDEGDLKNYYLISSVIISMVLSTSFMLPADENMFVSALDAIGSIIITIIGINVAFMANGGSAGNRFIEKVVSISIPLLMKLFVSIVLLASVIVLLVFFFVSVFGFEFDESQIEWIGAIASLVMQSVFMWRLTVHVGATNDPQTVR
jgi:hypothetical protein